ncbi:hypothetical protein AHAS_Ahas09G0223600 [Arachis hypogaea]
MVFVNFGSKGTERSQLNSGKSGDLKQEDDKKTSELVVCLGELLIDFVPTVGGVSLAEAPAFKKAPGGAPANVAVGISRLGGSSAFIGKVGKDEFGYMLCDILKQNFVDTSAVRFDSEARTALAFVTLRADGEREFLFFRNPSADMLLHESEIDKILIQKAKIFHYGSISLIHDPCKSAHLAALRIAKESGCILSYDPNLRLALWPSAEAAQKGIMSVWDKADIIKISEEEITFLTKGDDPNDDDVVLKKLFHPDLKLLIVTQGSEGCRYYTKKFKGRVAGVKVNPIDTTGAGDAFVSGILYNIASDQSILQEEEQLRKALRFANICGAITVTKRGAIPALPNKEAVAQFIYIQENYSKIRDVERELANLTMEMKLTAGPKKAALELLRKKIETQTEKIRMAKLKEEQARKVWEAASKVVKDEEALKQKLCDDLSNLVQESSNSQFSRLEELKRRLEALNPNRASTNSHHDGKSASSSQDGSTRDGSSASNARESGGSAESIPDQGNGQKVGSHHQSPNEGEGRTKKKVNFHIKGKGIGAVSKGRSSAPGWTGAGFDVDGRT